MQKLLVSSFVAITAVLGVSYGAFEYWANLQASMLPKSVTQGKLTEVTSADVEKISSFTNLLKQSPLPWHQKQAQRFTNLLEVARAAEQSFSSGKVSQLQVGQLLTLEQEMEDYVEHYPNQTDAVELQRELPAVRALVTFFPIIKSSAAERSVDSALRASRRGATLAALVIRKPDEVMVAAAPVMTWSKAENDVLYDYSQALQQAERSRIDNGDRLQIGRQVCTWLENGQDYWGVRSLFDTQYKGQLAGDYYHNRDAYIRFGTERLCPDRMASLVRPADPSGVQIAKAPAAVAKVAAAAVNTWNAATNSTATTNPTLRWTADVQSPQYGQGIPMPYVEVQPIPGGMFSPNGPGFPGRIR
jgi:hypothetical protein